MSFSSYLTLSYFVFRIYFKDESYKSFMCDQNTTVEDVCSQFAERTHLRDFPDAFTLKERRNGVGTTHTHVPFVTGTVHAFLLFSLIVCLRDDSRPHLQALPAKESVGSRRLRRDE